MNDEFAVKTDDTVKKIKDYHSYHIEQPDFGYKDFILIYTRD